MKILVGMALFYVSILAFMFFFQTKFIFHANPLPENHRYDFAGKFEEITIPSFDKTKLNGVLFHADNPKGLVFFLHGNSGNIQGWSSIADIYTSRGYDIFILDYRGFGKSLGEVETEEQVYRDLDAAYDLLSGRYKEQNTIVAGFSIGTGLAAYLAAKHHPKKLMLQAPYYNLTEMTRHRFPFVPTFLLRFRFPTSEYIQKANCPIWIFHGTADNVIPVEQGKDLSELLKKGDRFVEIPGLGHRYFNQDTTFQTYLDDVLR